MCIECAGAGLVVIKKQALSGILCPLSVSPSHDYTAINTGLAAIRQT